MKKLLLATAATFLSLASAQAVPILSAGSISSGGLTFSSFTCSSGGSVGTTVGGCGTVDVSALPGAGLTFGTLLQTAAGSTITPISGLDVIIGYTVTSPTLLSSIGLNFNGAVSGSTGTAEVREQAFGDANRSILLGSAIVSTTSGILSTTLSLNPSVFTAYIVKDIQLSSFSGGALTTSTISTINQPYTPTPTPVPEPATLALFGTALLGLGAARRSRRRAS